HYRLRSGNGVGRAEQARRSYTLSYGGHHPRDRLIGDVSRDFLAGARRDAAAMTRGCAGRGEVRRMMRVLRRRDCGQGRSPTIEGVAETFVALNRGPRVQAMEI